MSIQHCESFLLETLLAIHDFSSDVIKVALFNGDARFDSETTAYSSTNEVPNGGGYTTGGQALTLVSTYPKIEARAGAVRYEPVTWTFTANATLRWALIYNSSKANRAILSIDLGTPRTLLGEFILNFPLAAAPIINQRAPMPSL